MNDHIKAPPVPEPCSECGYPEASQHDCPGTSLIEADEAAFSNNVRVQKGAPTLSAMVVLSEATEAMRLSGYAYRSTGDPIMRDSLLQALYRATNAVQRLLVEVQVKTETDVRAQSEGENDVQQGR